MANGGLLISTAVTGLLLVGAALVVVRLRKRGEYRPTLESVRGSAPASVWQSNAVPLAIAAVLVAFAAAAVALGDPALLVFALVPAAIAGFFAYGVYMLARARGLPTAHSVGLSAWLFGVVLSFAVGVKLLVA